ncbi:ESX-1 secretion-associated protein [Mycobacterium camsae]|uniref:ESX-1 secretion-associated protein n=1 Tax=Mycobacterium gordonae TaxID=1778 RepID=UPI001981139A|nr:ESX-1 secretion-associated protein [Mycobacterium gordonae]
MEELTISPSYLEQLAIKQEQASTAVAEAAAATSAMTKAVWVTHGVISGSSNTAFEAAEAVRRAASVNLRTVATDLAAKLRTAKETYVGVDEELGSNLSKQFLAR